MKKTFAIVCVIFAFVVIYFLQADFFSWFTIAKVKPNLFVIFVLWLGLFAGKKVGTTIGFILGIFLDLLIGRSLGITAILLAAIGFTGEYFDKNFSKESRLTIIFMVIGSTLIYEFGAYFLNSIILEFDRELLYFTKIVVVEILYNILITIILYPLIQKFGYVIDRNLKHTNILTRYF